MSYDDARLLKFVLLRGAHGDTRQYRVSVHARETHRRRQNFYALPTAQWQLLSKPPINFLATLDEVDNAIESNADVAADILSHGLRAFGLESEPRDKCMDWRDQATLANMNKCVSAIRQLRRDWSEEGADERQRSYEPVLQALKKEFGHVPDKGVIKVLNPGAGLGRLVFEICRAGYFTEGNEIDYHMLITSNWVLNHTQKAKQFRVSTQRYNLSLDQK